MTAGSTVFTSCVALLLFSSLLAAEATVPSLSLLRRQPQTTAAATAAASSTPCVAGDLACACKSLLNGEWIASPRSGQRACNVTSWPYEGRDRSFLVFFPPRYDPAITISQQQQQQQQRPPLWLHLHGMASTNWSHTSGAIAQGALVDAERLRIAAAAARHGAIAVAPQGFGAPACQVWGVGFWSPRSLLPACVDSPADDAGFVANLTAALPARLGADPKRVYLSGFSNGAMLALQLLCARPRDAARLRAVALLAPAFGADYAAKKCAAGRSNDSASSSGSVRVPPVLLIHGTADQTLPFAGGVRISNTTMLGADGTAAFLASRAACGGSSSSSGSDGTNAARPLYPPPQGPAPPAPYWRQLSGKRVACSSYCPQQQQQQQAAPVACARSVAMCSVEGGSHSVPEFGAPGEVTELVWDFFNRATC